MLPILRHCGEMSDEHESSEGDCDGFQEGPWAAHKSFQSDEHESSEGDCDSA